MTITIGNSQGIPMGKYTPSTGGGGADLTEYYNKTETDGLLDEKQDVLTPTAPINIGTTTIGGPKNINTSQGVIQPLYPSAEAIEPVTVDNTGCQLRSDSVENPSTWSQMFDRDNVSYFDIPVNFASEIKKVQDGEKSGTGLILKIDVPAYLFSACTYLLIAGNMSEEGFEPITSSYCRLSNSSSTVLGASFLTGEVKNYSDSILLLTGDGGGSTSIFSGSTTTMKGIFLGISYDNTGTVAIAQYNKNSTTFQRCTSTNVVPSEEVASRLSRINMFRVIIYPAGAGGGVGYYPSVANTKLYINSNTPNDEETATDWNINSGAVTTYGISLKYDHNTLEVNDSGELTAITSGGDLTNYYNKEETDGLLETKENKITSVTPISLTESIRSSFKGFTYTDETHVYPSTPSRFMLFNGGRSSSVPHLLAIDIDSRNSEDIWGNYIDIPYSLGDIIKLPDNYTINFGITFGYYQGAMFVPVVMFNRDYYDGLDRIYVASNTPDLENPDENPYTYNNNLYSHQYYYAYYLSRVTNGTSSYNNQPATLVQVNRPSSDINKVRAYLYDHGTSQNSSLEFSMSAETTYNGKAFDKINVARIHGRSYNSNSTLDITQVGKYSSGGINLWDTTLSDLSILGDSSFVIGEAIKQNYLELKYDNQTIQVNSEGELVANLDELGNEVNTLAGRVTALEENDSKTSIINEVTSGVIGKAYNSSEDEIVITEPITARAYLYAPYQAKAFSQNDAIEVTGRTTITSAETSARPLAVQNISDSKMYLNHAVRTSINNGVITFGLSVRNYAPATSVTVQVGDVIDFKYIYDPSNSTCELLYDINSSGEFISLGSVSAEATGYDTTLTDRSLLEIWVDGASTIPADYTVKINGNLVFSGNWVEPFIDNKVNAISGRVTALETNTGGFKFVKLTQADYDALETKDENTMYVING